MRSWAPSLGVQRISTISGLARSTLSTPEHGTKRRVAAMSLQFQPKRDTRQGTLCQRRHYAHRGYFSPSFAPPSTLSHYDISCCWWKLVKFTEIAIRNYTTSPKRIHGMSSLWSSAYSQDGHNQRNEILQPNWILSDLPFDALV